MSTVIWALSPHPPLLIPEVGGISLERVRHTREAMEETCREVAARRPERLVLITPHGPVHPRAVPVFLVERLAGTLGRFGHPEVSVEVEVDRELAEEIARAAEARGVAILRLEEHDPSLRGMSFELDHALMVPLYYLRAAGVHVPTVVMGTSYVPEDHVGLGQAVREVLDRTKRRVAFVASGDLSHRLLESGPYGFDEMGPVFDQKMMGCLQEGDASGILAIPEDLVERAGQCGMRPILTLLGSLAPGAKARVRSYEGPFGVGYAVVQYDPAEVEGVEPAAPEEPRARPLDVRLEVARRAVEEYVLHGRRLEVGEAVPEETRPPGAAFVTLKLRGQLRGCIGTLVPTCPNQLQEVAQNAVSACSRDPRFPPVTPAELPLLDYQVYILEPSEPVPGLEALDPRRYGVIVRKGPRSGVLLPGIEGIDTAEDQVAIACRKAGIDPEDRPDLERFEVVTYQEESEPAG